MGHHDPVDTILAVLDALPTAEAAYFIALEDNTRIAFERPWVSVGSDADAQSTETLFAGQPVHTPFIRNFRPYSEPLHPRHWRAISRGMRSPNDQAFLLKTSVWRSGATLRQGDTPIWRSSTPRR